MVVPGGEKKPGILRDQIIPAGTTVQLGTISYTRGKKLWMTTRVTYNASATDGITIRIYYTPIEELEDTSPLITEIPTFSAGSTVQETFNYSVPLNGKLRIEVQNNDENYDATLTIIFQMDTYNYGESETYTSYNLTAVS